MKRYVVILCAGAAAAAVWASSVAGQTPPHGTPQPAVPYAVSYAAGWNLISGTGYPTISGADGPLYTQRPGDTGYRSIAPTQRLAPGYGYWAYFDQPSMQYYFREAGQCVTQVLPAGQWVLVGDPDSEPISVHGADALYTWDAVRGAYAVAFSLMPGQGALAISVAGGTLTFGSATPGSSCGIVPTITAG